MSETIQSRVMRGKSASDQQLVQNIAESLDAIRNNRCGFADPVEDWLYDAADQLVQSVRQWDAAKTEAQP